MKQETVYKIDYHEFEDLVIKEYGVNDFSFVADQEMANDTCKSFLVSKDTLDTWDINDLNKFKNNEFVPYISNMLFTDLCNRGVIDEGEYIVDVCW